MTQRCFQAEELSDILDLEEADPRRRHLDECPRCRALLSEYRDFLKPPQEMPGTNLEDAGSRLREVLEREIREGEPSSPVKRIIESRTFRMVMAVAATICVIIIAYSFKEDRPPESDGIVLREEPGAGREDEIALRPVQPLSEGAVKLSWRTAAGADAFKVYFFSAELEELAVLGPQTESSIVLQPGEIPGLPGSGTLLLWRVGALKEGDEIASSPLGTLRLP